MRIFRCSPSLKKKRKKKELNEQKQEENGCETDSEIKLGE